MGSGITIVPEDEEKLGVKPAGPYSRYTSIPVVSKVTRAESTLILLTERAVG